MGYGSIYEFDRVIEIKKGKLISDNVFSNQEYLTQYHHKIPDSLHSFEYNRLDWSDINLKRNEQHSISAALFINKVSGKIDSLSVTGASDLLPQVEPILIEFEKFEPVYRHGKYYYLPIWINININTEVMEKYTN